MRASRERAHAALDGVRVNRPTAATCAGLFAALAGPPLFVIIPDRLLGESPALAVQVVLQVLYISLAALVLWIVVGRERLPLGSIGLRRPDWTTLLSGTLLWIAVSFLLPLATMPLARAFGVEGLHSGLQKLAVLPVWFRVVVGASGGFVEEVCYRGYAIERLTAILENRLAAAIISIVVFGLVHIPAWGVGFALGADLPFGIVMTLVYLWRRDLIANVAAHSTALVVALLTVVPRA